MNPSDSAPLLSRIVTVYRQWDSVARWIDDPALADPRVEWVFVNDSPSPDDLVPAPLRETAVGRRARFVEDGVNRGRSAARNRGASLATAPWLAHVDGDDRPLAVELPLAVFHGESDGGPMPDLVFLPFASDAGTFWTEERIDTAVFGELFRALGVPKAVDWRPAALLWRREFFGRIGGYDGRFEGAEDAHVVWKALRAGAQAARGAAPQVFVEPGGARTEQIYLTAGRLRFWEEVGKAGGDVGAIGRRVRAVQLHVVFWTVRDVLVRTEGRKAGLREGGKLIWNFLFARKGRGR